MVRATDAVASGTRYITVVFGMLLQQVCVMVVYIIYSCGHHSIQLQTYGVLCPLRFGPGCYIYLVVTFFNVTYWYLVWKLKAPRRL